jgi:hypothetical protein
MNDQPPKSPEEIAAERRRQRWGYFWTPFIAMTSVVSSVTALMFLIKTCDERGLPRLLLPPTSPLRDQRVPEPARHEPSFRQGDLERTTVDKLSPVPGKKGVDN